MLAPPQIPESGPLWKALFATALVVITWTVVGLASPTLAARVPLMRWAVTRGRVVAFGVVAVAVAVLIWLLRFDPTYVEAQRVHRAADAARDAREAGVEAAAADSVRAAEEAAQDPMRRYSDVQRKDVTAFTAALHEVVEPCRAAHVRFVRARQRMDTALLRDAQGLERTCARAAAAAGEVDVPALLVESLPRMLASRLRVARSEVADGAEDWAESARFAQRALTGGRSPKTLMNDQIVDPAAEWTLYMNTNEASGVSSFGWGRRWLDEVAVAVGLPPGQPRAEG